MAQLGDADLDKLSQAFQCIRKTLECTLCHKLPTEAETAKCGHPFCKNCVDKVLHTKKAICSVCKTVIIRSAVRRLPSVDKIVEDFNSLWKAVEKDSNAAISLDKQRGPRKYQRNRESLTLPGPSGSKTKHDSSSRSELSTERNDSQNKRRQTRAEKIERRESVDSEETIKIQPKKPTNKRKTEPSAAPPSTSKTTYDNSGAVFTDDNLSAKIGRIGFQEKIEGWLNAEEFQDKATEEVVFPNMLRPPESPCSSPASEILESFSQEPPNYGGYMKSGRNSRASVATKKNGKGIGSVSTVDNEKKFPSFTFEATNSKMKKPNTRAVPVPENKMFDELRSKSIEPLTEDKKSKVPSVSADTSWKELKRLKKESHPKIRKKNKLNISIERPNSLKPMLEASDREDSEEREAQDISSVENRKDKSAELNERSNVVVEAPRAREKPNVVSSRKLDKAEMICLQKLNRHQVKEIIGVLDTSKNSSKSPDETSIRSNKNQLSLSRSGEHSRDNTNEEESTSHIKAGSRPQSKQSIHPNDSRPGSRVSSKSTGEPVSEKFRLSTRKRTPTPNRTALDSNTDQQRKDTQEKIQLGSDSPVRVCNDSMRSKLSLKRLSPGSSKMTDRDSRNSIIVSIKKMGKLCKPVSRTKFYRLGSIKPKSNSKELMITTRNVSTQTIINLSNFGLISDTMQDISSESMARNIIPETRTVSVSSTVSRNIKKSSKTVSSQASQEELDTVNKVNLLSPDKDSQLKYLAAKSPLVPRIDYINYDQPIQTGVQSDGVTRETSFTNSSIVTTGKAEYSRVVKKKGEALIVTDSDDQDKPSESFRSAKRRCNYQAERNGTSVGISSKTASNLSDVRMDDKIDTAGSSDVINASTSQSVHSVGNNLRGKLSHASPKRKRHSRERDSFDSQTKKCSPEKAKLLSYREKSPQSDGETVLLKKAKNTDATQPLGDSEGSTITRRHKVVRKLKYSQDSASNPKTESGNNEVLEKKKSNRIHEQKTFQRIRRIPSTDSENELLEISLTTKESSGISQTIPRPGASQEVSRSPILSDDMTIVFSSNRDTQESKRKRSQSPNSLNNNDVQTIASNWCAELQHSSEETLVAKNRVLELAEVEAPLKKPRVETQVSPASTSSDKFPALSPTAIYGNQRKSNEKVETAKKINDHSLDNEESQLINDLEAVAGQFDSIDDKNPAERNIQAFNLTNTRHINLAANIECSIKRGNTLNGVISTNKTSIPIKAKSLERRDQSVVNQQSQNSDKENELSSQASRRRQENTEIPANEGQKIASNDDLNKLQVNCKYYENSKVENPFKSNSKSVPSKTNLTSNTELFESSFDRDCMNITQEQLLMQELEENLLGRRSRQDKTAKKSPEKNSENTLSEMKPSNKNIKSFQTAQVGTDDSEIMDEDIIESTPERNLQFKKDSYADALNSQRSNASLKSFMSVDMTPIPKGNPKRLGIGSADVSFEPGSRLSSNVQTMSKSLKTHPSRHSTPKFVSSKARRTKLSEKSELSRLKTDECKDRRLCFVCSCLSLPQVENVKAFARKYNVDYSANYVPEVTHVIVETNERDSAGRTLKYLLGVAHKKWIVSYRWITDSMSQNKILDEENYEAVDSETEEPGPRRSRLSKKGLFDEFAFLCMEPFADIKKVQLQDLLSSTGGTVVQSLEDLAAVENKYRVILYNSEVHETVILDNWYKNKRALPVLVEWVIACISQYELVSLHDYLHMDTALVSDMGFPPELLMAEEDDSCSGNEQST